MKVIQQKKPDGKWDLEATFNDVINEAFDETIKKEVDNTGWASLIIDGVKVQAISDGGWGWSGHQLMGIKLRVHREGGRKDIFRKVMVKYQEIDEKAIRTKLEELRPLAAQEKQEQAKDSAYRYSVHTAYAHAASAAGYSADIADISEVQMYPNDEKSVLLVANVTPEQQMEIARLIHIPRRILRLVTPVELAPAIYRIMVKENGTVEPTK